MYTRNWASAEGKTADWSVLDIPEVMEAVEKAAARAVRKFDHAEYDDALQDAKLWAALHHDDVRSKVNDMEKLVARIYDHGVRQSLITESNRRKMSIYVDGEPGDRLDMAVID